MSAVNTVPGIECPSVVLCLAERRKRSRARSTAPASGTPGGQTNGRRRVMLFGQHRELSLYRAEVLRHSGFSVALPRDRQEARETIREGGIGAVILSYTLSSEAVEEIAEMVRQYCPECPLITISKERTSDRLIRPDANVVAEDGPQALVEALQRVCGKQLQ